MSDTGNDDQQGQDSGQSDGQNDTSESMQANESGQSGEQHSGQSEGQAQRVDDLPEWAQKQIRDARKEAGDNRAGRKAAEQKQSEQLDAIAKALGLKEDEKVDPDHLAKDLASARTAQRTAQIELAVHRTASKHQGDASALLDSRAFLAKVQDLDPNAKDFAAKVDSAIKDAVKDNPKLRATQAATSSSVDHTGGPGERRTGEPKSLDQAVALSYGT